MRLRPERHKFEGKRLAWVRGTNHSAVYSSEIRAWSYLVPNRDVIQTGFLDHALDIWLLFTLSHDYPVMLNVKDKGVYWEMNIRCPLSTVKSLELLSDWFNPFLLELTKTAWTAKLLHVAKPDSTFDYCMFSSATTGRRTGTSLKINFPEYRSAQHRYK